MAGHNEEAEEADECHQHRREGRGLRERLPRLRVHPKVGDVPRVPGEVGGLPSAMYASTWESHAYVNSSGWLFVNASIKYSLY